MKKGLAMDTVIPYSVLNKAREWFLSRKPKDTTMTITNAIKKLEKAGFTIENFENRIFYARNPKASRLIEFHRNGRSEDVATIHLRRKGEKACHHTDYLPGFFVDTITKAIKRAI